MLEWLKTILGDAYTEDIDKKVSAEIGKGFVAKADFNTLNEEKKNLTTQLAERDSQLEELKKVDAAGLQAKIAELQKANADAKAEYEQNLKAAQLDYAISSSLTVAKGKDPKAVKALRDKNKVKLDGDKLLGLDDQLEALKTSDPYLFEIETKKQEGNPFNPGDPPKPGEPDYDKMSDEEYYKTVLKKKE